MVNDDQFLFFLRIIIAETRYYIVHLTDYLFTTTTIRKFLKRHLKNKMFHLQMTDERIKSEFLFFYLAARFHNKI